MTMTPSNPVSLEQVCDVLREVYISVMREGWKANPYPILTCVCAIDLELKRRESEAVPKECPACHKNWGEHRSGYSASKCSMKPPSKPSTGVPDGWEIDVGHKCIAIRCRDGRKAVLRSGIGMTYNDKVVFDYFTAAAPRSP